MQLFSIGLVELNKDGTTRLDSEGKSIRTYSNDDIMEYARVFTGFGKLTMEITHITLDSTTNVSLLLVLNVRPPESPGKRGRKKRLSK